MEWASMLLGAVVGIALDRVVGQVLDDRCRAWLQRRRYRIENAEWNESELASGSLTVTQTGWDDDGCFAPSSVTIRLDGEYEPAGSVSDLRNQHSDEWASAGLTDGRQVGIKSRPLVRRDTDEPEAARDGTSHSIQIEAHEYSYFNFLATHRLRLTGSEAERSLLDELAGDTRKPGVSSAFPNPLSVGLSVLPDDGNTLALVRRSSAAWSGGWWCPGSIFNAVGENCARRDFFPSAIDGRLTSSPEVIAMRGLREETDLTADDLQALTLRLHTLAWASDLLDYKFFGLAVTPLSSGEFTARLQAAPDRSEGENLMLIDVSTRARCRALLQTMRAEPDDWSREAVVCTLRSLLTLRRIAPSDLRRPKA